MGILADMQGPDIREGLEEWRNSPGAVLIDVRDRDEYAAGHIQGAMNIPAKEIEMITAVIPEKTKKIFVYCLSGIRSKKAAARMAAIGYTEVKSIGGIKGYTGELVK